MRTPADRRELAYLDEFMEARVAEFRLSAREKVIAHLQRVYPGISTDEAERRRLTMIEELREGRVWFESPDERQVASMFLGLNEGVDELIATCDWTFVRFPEPSRRLVLCDRGITLFDTSGEARVGGIGLLSSRTVETVLAVSPRSAFVIRPGRRMIGSGVGNDHLAAELNLRSYASSETCVYGCSQADVVEAHREARQNPRGVGERRRRPRTMWISTTPPNPDGTQTFTGYSIEGEQTATFRVSPNAYKGRPIRPEDFWDDEPTPVSDDA